MTTFGIIIAFIAGAILVYLILNYQVISKYKATEQSLGEQMSEVNKELLQTRADRDQHKEELIRLRSELNHASMRLKEQKEAYEKLHEQLAKEFQHVANKVVLDSSQKVQERHEEKLRDLLDPFRKKIADFEKRVEDTHMASMKDNTTLKEQINQLKELNKNIGEEAKNLTKALKGDKKIQGDWGEERLERILQAAGLEKGTHYKKQVNLKDDLDQNFRPDYIIYLPDEKNLVVDAKVSLIAYEKYYSAENEVEASRYLSEHLRNVKDHIQRLSQTDYSKLHGINSPDYVIMYMPIDGALGLAMTEDTEIFEQALRKNIVLVSNNTLLATLRTVAFIWRQDMQNKNALEIARQGGALYDKFVGFVDTLQSVGKKIGSAQEDYQKAMNQLSEGRGNLVKKAEDLKKLGIKTSKQMDDKLLNE